MDPIASEAVELDSVRPVAPVSVVAKVDDANIFSHVRSVIPNQKVEAAKSSILNLRDFVSRHKYTIIESVDSFEELFPMVYKNDGPRKNLEQVLENNLLSLDELVVIDFESSHINELWFDYLEAFYDLSSVQRKIVKTIPDEVLPQLDGSMDDFTEELRPNFKGCR